METEPRVVVLVQPVEVVAQEQHREQPAEEEPAGRALNRPGEERARRGDAPDQRAEIREHPGVRRSVEHVGRLAGEVLERPIGRSTQSEDDEHRADRGPVDDDEGAAASDRARASLGGAPLARQLGNRRSNEKHRPAELAEEAQDILDVVEILGDAVEQLCAEEPGERGDDEPGAVPADEVAVPKRERERAEAEDGRSHRLGNPDLREVVVVDQEHVVDEQAAGEDAAPKPRRACGATQDEPGEERAGRRRDPDERRRVGKQSDVSRCVEDARGLSREVGQRLVRDPADREPDQQHERGEPGGQRQRTTVAVRRLGAHSVSVAAIPAWISATAARTKKLDQVTIPKSFDPSSMRNGESSSSATSSAADTANNAHATSRIQRPWRRTNSRKTTSKPIASPA